jgi:hypothetical protein
MSENASIDELLDERRGIEAALGEIKNRLKAGELDVLQRGLGPRTEFSALKKLSLKSHQEGASFRVRLGEINAKIAELRGGQKQGRAIAEIIALLKEIRDAVCDTARQL